MSLDLFGTDDLGFDAGDLGTIFQAAGELAKGGFSIYEKDQAGKKLEADEKASLAAALAADKAAAMALAKAAVSAALKDGSAPLDKDAADLAVQAQDRAAAKLSVSAAAKRAEAAELELSAAQGKAKDAFGTALVKAWIMTVTKAHNGQIRGAGGAGSGGDSGGSGEAQGRGGRRGGGGGGAGSDAWFNRKIGPVPVWGVAVGGAGVAALLARKFLL